MKFINLKLHTSTWFMVSSGRQLFLQTIYLYSEFVLSNHNRSWDSQISTIMYNSSSYLFYGVESFEMSLSLNHFHTKLSLEILEMFSHAIKLR